MGQIVSVADYFNRVALALDACCHVAGPLLVEPEDLGTGWLWDDVITFGDPNLQMRAVERIMLDSSGRPHRRNFTFDFRERNQLVFRFDTHGRLGDVDAPCHLHYAGPQGREAIIECRNGKPDWLVHIDFLDALRYASRHIQQEPCPWQ